MKKDTLTTGKGLVIEINQNGIGQAFTIYWMTCLDCGWQSMTGEKNKNIRCWLCGSKNIKWRSDDEDFFQKASDKLLELRKNQQFRKKVKSKLQIDYENSKQT